MDERNSAGASLRAARCSTQPQNARPPALGLLSTRQQQPIKQLLKDSSQSPPHPPVLGSLSTVSTGTISSLNLPAACAAAASAWLRREAHSGGQQDAGQEGLAAAATRVSARHGRPWRSQMPADCTTTPAGGPSPTRRKLVLRLARHAVLGSHVLAGDACGAWGWRAAGGSSQQQRAGQAANCTPWRSDPQLLIRLIQPTTQPGSRNSQAVASAGAPPRPPTQPLHSAPMGSRQSWAHWFSATRGLMAPSHAMGLVVIDSTCGRAGRKGKKGSPDVRRRRGEGSREAWPHSAAAAAAERRRGMAGSVQGPAPDAHPACDANGVVPRPDRGSHLGNRLQACAAWHGGWGAVQSVSACRRRKVRCCNEPPMREARCAVQRCGH